MKKVILFFVLAAMTFSGCSNAGKGEVKVQAQFQKGDTVIYTIQSAFEMNLTGQSSKVNMEMDTRFVVTDATADGYLVEQITTRFKSDADKSDLIGRMMTIAFEMAKDFKTVYKTDKDGKVTGIANMDELTAKMDSVLPGIVDDMASAISENTGADKQIAKDAMMKEIRAKMNEKYLIDQVSSLGIFALYGKTISTGASDSIFADNMKLKNVYTLLATNPLQVKSAITFDMSKDELKKQMKANIMQELPDTTREEFKGAMKQIDSMMDSGMFKIDITGDSEYTFMPIMWVQSFTSNMTTSSMGQNTTVRTNGKCTYCNRK